MHEKRESSALREPLKNESETTLHHQLVQYCSLLPDNLSKEEKEHRQVVLWAIGEKVRNNGAHEAFAHPERARQFMPFAALKGYEELIQRENAKSAQIR